MRAPALKVRRIEGFSVIKISKVPVLPPDPSWRILARRPVYNLSESTGQRAGKVSLPSKYQQEYLGVEDRMKMQEVVSVKPTAISIHGGQFCFQTKLLRVLLLLGFGGIVLYPTLYAAFLK